MEPLFQIGCTRKLDDALVEAASIRGIQIQAQEVLNISYWVRSETAKELTENKFPLVITSAHALRAYELLQENFPMEASGHLAFCIAGKTSARAIESGFCVLASAKDSRSLAASIASDFPYKRLLHLGSNLDMKKWKAQLKEKGIQVDTLELYHKTAAPKYFHAPHGMLFFSPSQVEIFYRCNKLDIQTPAFCIGETTAEAVKAFHHQEIIIPNQPDTKLLLEKVFQYYQTP